MNQQNDQTIHPVDITLTVEKIEELKIDWKKHADKTDQFFGQKIGEGKGIVISAGGLKYFTSAWVLIKSLRNLGCTLPIEVWSHGQEMSNAMKKQLSKLGVKCKNLDIFIDDVPHGFLMKPLSILYSNFKEVLFLDADNMCVKDPSYLFQDQNYLEYGCLFWPDYWQTTASNPIWNILEINYFKTNEQDSGQILIDKSKSWDQLQLCTYFNIRYTDYYKFLYGDKDTFRFAWLALGKPYYMIKSEVGTCGYIDKNKSFNGTTMVQHDTNNDIIFLHRNLLKWDITLKNESVWKTIKVFTKNATDKRCNFKRSPNHHHAIDINGDIEEHSFDELFPGFEQQCLDILNKLRSSHFYKTELMNSYLNKNRFTY